MTSSADQSAVGQRAENDWLREADSAGFSAYYSNTKTPKRNKN